MSHANDGTKTFRLDISAGFYDDGYSPPYKPVSGSGTFEMVVIPRASSISSISNDGMTINGSNALTVNIARNSNSFTHDVTITFGSYTQTLTGQGTSSALVIPLSWIGRFGNNGSGSLKGTVTVQTKNGTSNIGSAVSKEFTLNCPSASSFSLTTSNIECNGTNKIGVNISRSVSSFSHRVRFVWASYYQDINGVGTSTEFAPPTSWLNAIPNSTSGYGAVEVLTFYGNQQIGATVSKRFDMSVPNYTPNFSGVSVSIVQDTRISDWGIYVQKYSKAKFVFNGASGVYGSTITRYAMTLDGVGYENTSNTITSNIINGSGTLKYGVSVRDSRNKEAYKEGTISVSALVAPKFTSASIYRYDGTKENDEGTQLYFLFNYTFETYNGLNSTVNEIYIKKDTELSFSRYGTFTNGTPFVITNYYFDDNSSYEIRVIVTDELGNKIQYDKSILSAMALIDCDGVNNGLGILRRSSKANTVQIEGDLEVTGSINGAIAKFDETKVNTISQYTLVGDYHHKVKRKIVAGITYVAGVNYVNPQLSDMLFPLKVYGGFAQTDGKFQIFPESCCDDVASFGISVRDITKNQIAVMLGTKYVGTHAPLNNEGHIIIEYVSTELL
jgi:hypothetical protein